MQLKGKKYIPREKFSHEEDLKIVGLFEKYGTDWPKISLEFFNRTATMLKNRYYSFINKKNRYQDLLAEFEISNIIELNDVIASIEQKPTPITFEKTELVEEKSTIVNPVPISTRSDQVMTGLGNHSN